MTPAIQNVKGPASAPTLPSHGSIHPAKEKEMNKEIDITAPAEMSRKIGDVVDLLATVRFLNEALFMAAGASGITKHATNALQAVSGEMDSKLLAIEERLEDLMEGLK